MSLSKLASWMNTLLTIISLSILLTFVHLHTMNIFLCFPSFNGKKILQQFVAFWTEIKLACFVPPEFEVCSSNTIFFL